MCASHGALRSRSNSPPRGLVMQEESLDDRTCSVTPLFPEHKIDQRFVDMQVAVVMNEAFFPELAHEGKAGVNWSDLDVMTKAGVNWTDINVLSKAGVNWTGVRALSEGGVNWTDINVMSKAG